jgi:hypothetical protein
MSKNEPLQLAYMSENEHLRLVLDIKAELAPDGLERSIAFIQYLVFTALKNDKELAKYMTQIDFSTSISHYPHFRDSYLVFLKQNE